MKRIAELFRRNWLGPLGLLGAAVAAAGILFPWKTVTGQGFINGTTDMVGWVLALLCLLYVLILFTHFRWNILLALAILVIGIYKYLQVAAETTLAPNVHPGIGLKLVMGGSLLMMAGTALLFRRKKEE